MTVIAWDGKTLVADRLGVDQGLQMTVTKIIKKDDLVFACTGALCHFPVLVKWYADGADVEKYPEFQLSEEWSRLICANKEGVFFYESAPYPITIEDPFFAWGTGADFAIGAMEMGASAEQAVIVASKHSAYCGKGVTSFELK